MSGTVARISASGDVTVKGEVLQIPAALQGTGARNWVKDSERTIAVRSNTFFTYLSDLKEIRGKRVTISVGVDVKNITTGGRLGFEPALNFADGTNLYLNLWHYVSVGDSFTGRISKSFTIPDKEIGSLRQTGMYIQCDGEVTKLSNPMLVIGEETAPWRPAPEDLGVNWLPLWVQDFNNPVSFSDTGDMAVSGEIVEIPDELKGTGGRNLLPNAADERTGGSEFLRHNDVAPILDHYGLRQYTFSFDIKAPVPGTVMVYLQNGSGARYTFSKHVTVTTEFTRLSVTTTPVVSNLNLSAAHLAFYGTYGTGRIPTVKNVKVEIGGVVTPHALAPEDVGIDWLPDWVLNFDTPFAVNDNEAGIALGGLSETPDAIKFNGTSSNVKIPHSTSLSPSAELTLESWVWFDGNTGDRAVIIEKLGTYYLTIDTNAKLSVFWYGTSMPGYHSSTAAITKGKWTHIAAVWDGTHVHLYIDGQLDRSAATATPGRVTDAEIQMGMENGGRRLTGRMNHAKIWSRALSQTEVQASMHRHTRGNEPGLVAFWKADEGGGTTLHDTTANNNHGTLYDAVEWVSSLD